MTSYSSGALILFATIAAFLLGSGSAAAQTLRTSPGADQMQVVYHSSNPAGCVVVESIEQVETPGSTLRIFGSVWVVTPCFEGLSQALSMPNGHLAVRLKLWKWNGTSLQVCMDFPQWIFNQGSHRASMSLVTSACGDGQYNLGVDGCAWLEGAWRCGTTFSGWFNFDVSDDPPVVLN